MSDSKKDLFPEIMNANLKSAEESCPQGEVEESALMLYNIAILKTKRLSDSEILDFLIETYAKKMQKDLKLASDFIKRIQDEATGKLGASLIEEFLKKKE